MTPEEEARLKIDHLPDAVDHNGSHKIYKDVEEKGSLYHTNPAKCFIPRF